MVLLKSLVATLLGEIINMIIQVVKIIRKFVTTILTWRAPV